MVIDTTKESRCCVLANHFDQKVRATRVFFDEVRYIVDET